MWSDRLETTPQTRWRKRGRSRPRRGGFVRTYGHMRLYRTSEFLDGLARRHFGGKVGAQPMKSPTIRCSFWKLPSQKKCETGTRMSRRSGGALSLSRWIQKRIRFSPGSGRSLIGYGVVRSGTVRRVWMWGTACGFPPMEYCGMRRQRSTSPRVSR
jgi:hypothetical protein